MECDALLVVAGSHLEVAAQAVEDAEAEADAHLGGGAAAVGGGAARKHVEAEHERVGQSLAILARPKS